jgi:hypothetical protein
MGRHVQKTSEENRPARDECDTLSVVDVAREGVLQEGGKPVGWVKTLSCDTGEIVEWIAVRAKIEGIEGTLTLDQPFEDTFRIESRAVKTPHKRLWYIECPGTYVKEGTGRRVLRSCGRLVRTLYRPDRGLTEDLFAPWRCRHCWRVRYLDRGKDGELARARRSLLMHEEHVALLHQCIEMDRSIVAMLQHQRAMRKQEAAERARLRAQGWTFRDESSPVPLS